jgi:hypothetical protein
LTLVALVAVSGCGHSSVARDGPAVVRGVSVKSVERAMLTRGGPPRPTTSDCRASSAAERASTPFGHTRRPLFTCEVTVLGERATYDVQVLHNGCFVAERRRVGRAVYGCGAGRS